MHWLSWSFLTNPQCEIIAIKWISLWRVYSLYLKLCFQIIELKDTRVDGSRTLREIQGEKKNKQELRFHDQFEDQW